MSVFWVMCSTPQLFQSPSGIYITPIPAVSTTCPLVASESAVCDARCHIAHSNVGLILFFNFHLSIWHLENNSFSLE